MWHTFITAVMPCMCNHSPAADVVAAKGHGVHHSLADVRACTLALCTSLQSLGMTVYGHA